MCLHSVTCWAFASHRVFAIWPTEEFTFLKKEILTPLQSLVGGTLNVPLMATQYTPWSEIWQAVAHQYSTRSILGFTLMVTQAFLYNAIFFTYTLILVQFYNVPAETVSVYLFPFAFGNLLGPILLGGVLDSIGRKTMVTLTYAISGVLLALTGYLFHIGVLTAEPEKGSVAWRRKEWVEFRQTVSSSLSRPSPGLLHLNSVKET
jgi:MFS family permease